MNKWLLNFIVCQFAEGFVMILKFWSVKVGSDVTFNLIVISVINVGCLIRSFSKKIYFNILVKSWLLVVKFTYGNY